MRARELEEKWSEKYKRSIDCSNPKGFSQRAHCAGRKKNEDVAEGTLGTVLSWPEIVNKIGGAMRATGWKAERKDDNSFMFSTRGQHDNEFYIVIIENTGSGSFAYALGTVEDGAPYIDDSFKGNLPTTLASVSELMDLIRDGFGLNEHIVKTKGGYQLRSKHGNKNLGTYPTKAGAEKRERQVQYFKHMNEGIDDFNQVHSAIKDLLPIAMAELKLKQLPKIHIKKVLDNKGQPSFGSFNGTDITLAVSGRHPVDICRTLAHELTHYSQGLKNQLSHESGETGSPEENEANSVAGIIMRNFSQKHPEYMKNESQ